MADGSKKYVAASVATTLTACPSAVRASYRAGTRTAATLPVAPSRTLAIRGPLLVQGLDRQHQPVRQLPPRHPVVHPVLPRPEERPVPRPVEGVRHHQVGRRLLAGGFRHLEQLGLADPDLQLELHQDAGEPPRLADAVDQLRGADQPDPNLRLGAPAL